MIGRSVVNYTICPCRRVICVRFSVLPLCALARACLHTHACMRIHHHPPRERALYVHTAVIMVTDGVLDNLYTKDIKSILARFDYTPCHTLARMKAERAKEELQAAAASTAYEAGDEPKRTPLERFKVRNVAPVITTDTAMAEAEKECRAMLRSISTMIAFESQKVGASTSAISPFAMSAMKEGYKYQGGKLDDSTVVAALVLHDDSIL